MTYIRNSEAQDVRGQFVDLDGERYYNISNVDAMAPFFISVVSASNHWLFISSSGCLSAGRIRPENALFPYRSVDYIHENAENTGSKAIVKVAQGTNASACWEPFNLHHDGKFDVERNIYKNVTGDKIVFQEVNYTLGLSYQYSWQTSDRFGFVRETEVANLDSQPKHIEIIDGIQNVLPPEVPKTVMQTSSALVDAYKWNERVDTLPLALYSLYAKLSDRADPAESLRATSVFSLVDNEHQVLLSSKELTKFRKNSQLSAQPLVRGERGAYLIHQKFELKPNQKQNWLIVADIDQTHKEVEVTKALLLESGALAKQIKTDIKANQDDLMGLMSGGDAWQLTSSEETDVHHYANVLFNSMRGGVFVDGYELDSSDVRNTFARINQKVAQKHRDLLHSLPSKLSHPELISLVKETQDEQLIRLAYEYLPLTFGRRHGDPSRPWNHYEINVRDDEGNRLLGYQGNWRDIFQNWEALALSYPKFIGSFMTKFVNASTVDGYNPYRITKEGIDWEMLEPENPWSNIGYWGDHQIIYLLKLLELADKYQSSELVAWLNEEHFSYANVPYEIVGAEQIFKNSKDTVTFNTEKQQVIDERCEKLGSDGRLVMGASDNVYLVSLMEKLLVPLLAKLSNFVLDGGIWLNTQRPEWNDANNAIVGSGLSMVTLYYMRRYTSFMTQLLERAPKSFAISKEVSEWLNHSFCILEAATNVLKHDAATPEFRKSLLVDLTNEGEKYRNKVYQHGFSSKTSVDSGHIKGFMNIAQSLIDRTIENNKREDGLYNAYNILDLNDDGAQIKELYPMLEGQVAVLSAGVLDGKQSAELLDNLFSSDMYRADQQTFMLYPDRALKGFMDKNSIDQHAIESSTLLEHMLLRNDTRIITKDINQKYHFNADFENSGVLSDRLNEVKSDYPSFADSDWKAVLALYEDVFEHSAFTGRSGTMFGYEGLGCIYWHMVSKLLLAVQENYQASYRETGMSPSTNKLDKYYYRIRKGIGFNKTPQNYGAFPTDPYSHTPKQAGAQQPGMTGQVKEEIITRFGELGIEVEQSQLRIHPTLLKASDFTTRLKAFNYIDVDGVCQSLALEGDGLAFTYCQVPFVYKVDKRAVDTSIHVKLMDGQCLECEGDQLSLELTQWLFERSAMIHSIYVTLPNSAVER
ncbi:hypothetical protein OQJ65_16895 [Vibrio sp. Sgm 22]|uniref:hypothetical protein n=1 Tax=unclassified Vibrio TaxID=2614977 RepID=UPI002248F8FE|nr:MULTISPECIES: hypothetical protein [unclassified Vibrio]MCX2760012.1 hypothetical protein [Vibrio sp. 14G-20]MCX2777000.1 hypothetical protein [Vibrio sp. Sgm 22]